MLFNKTHQYRSEKGENTMTNKGKINTHRKTAIIVGVLFIFVFPKVVYVDSYKKTESFFKKLMF